MELNVSLKIFDNYKCSHPENTIKRIEDGFKKIGLDLIYNEKIVDSLGTSIFSGYALIDILGFTQECKGVTSLLSKASAYAEMAERFSAGFIDFRIPLPEKSAKYRKLLKDISERRFLKGFIKTKNHKSTNFENINKYFHKKISKEKYESFKEEHLFDFLVDAYSLTHNKTVKIPIHFIELNSSSNGLAAGNTYEEAISQASFEIFERYAANKIISEKIICPTIDNDSIQNEIIQNYIKMFESLNIKVIIKDFTLNNTIPSIGVVFINYNIENDENKMKKDHYFKRINVGSHCNLNDAIIRCFTEYSQNVDTNELIKRKQADILYNTWVKILNKKYNGLDDEFKYFATHYDYYGDLSFLEKGEKISFKDLKCIINNDFLKDIEIITKICKKNNWDLLLIDYTHKILQFPTVRVIIPPISTDYDQLKTKCLNIKNLEERFNFFYGIKNFYRYVKEDSWIKNKKQIKILIENIEEYLSKQPEYYQFYLTRENSFGQLINLFYILPFLHLAADQPKEALAYFRALQNLGYHPPYESSFNKSLYITKYNPIIYQTYVDIITEKLEKNQIRFELNSNPFNPEKSTDELENMYSLLFEKINRSFL